MPALTTKPVPKPQAVVRWNNLPAIEAAFESAISFHIPKSCESEAADGPFAHRYPYQNVKNPKRISYDLAIRLNPACFTHVLASLNAQHKLGKLTIGGRKPAALRPFPEADMGPTIIVDFSATPQDLRDIATDQD